MNAKRLKKILEANDFNVNLSIQDGIQGAEVETWTGRGVNMIQWIHPFTPEEFKKRVSDFDIDEEIDTHRQDKAYKNTFTISESIEDFKDYQDKLNEVCKKI